MTRVSPEKIVVAIAEADLFGDKHSSEKFNVSRRTLYRWRDRIYADPALSRAVNKKKRALLNDWQPEATKTLKVALTELAKRIPRTINKEDAAVLHAIAGACKIVGELKLDATILLTQDIDEESPLSNEEDGDFEEEWDEPI